MTSFSADPWGLDGWTAAELAAAADALGMAWHDWADRPICPSTRCVLEAQRARLEALGPVDLGEHRTPAEARRRLLPDAVAEAPNWPDLGCPGPRSQAALTSHQPILRLDRRGKPYWVVLRGDGCDLEAANDRGRAPLLGGHGGEVLGEVLRFWSRPDAGMIGAELGWALTEPATRAFRGVTAGRLSFSVGAVLCGEVEVAPRLVVPRRWFPGEVSVVRADEAAHEVAGHLEREDAWPAIRGLGGRER